MEYKEIITLHGDRAYWAYYNEDGDYIVELVFWAEDVDINCTTMEQMYDHLIENGSKGYIYDSEDSDYESYLDLLNDPTSGFAPWIDCANKDALDDLIAWAKRNA